MKRPSFQFYPGDWLSDTALRSCSVGARGLWIDILCLMNDGTPYGYLKVNNKVILPPNLARILGATLQETEGWLRELSDADVYSVCDDGCIYSRRMVRDEEIRIKRAAGGIKGGNPALISQQKKVGSKVNLPPNLPPTPSSSSSSSVQVQKESDTKKKPSASPRGPALTDDSFLSELKRHYPDVDIGRELHKMDAWLLTPKGQGRKRTRKFVVNWLNKCDAPMQSGGNGHKESNLGWAGDYLEERKGHEKPDWAK